MPRAAEASETAICHGTRDADDPMLAAMDLLDRLGLTGRVDVSDVSRIVRDKEGLAVPLTIGR